jgi:hypothetical protein
LEKQTLTARAPGNDFQWGSTSDSTAARNASVSPELTCPSNKANRVIMVHSFQWGVDAGAGELTCSEETHWRTGSAQYPGGGRLVAPIAQQLTWTPQLDYESM